MEQELTPQQVFDQVVEHLRQQKLQSSSGGACLYRCQRNGVMLKCAAGILIKDEEYRPWMDSVQKNGDTSFHRILTRPECPTTLRERLQPHATLIRSLQVVHDDRDVESWECELQAVAIDFSLVYTPPMAPVPHNIDEAP